MEKKVKYIKDFRAKFEQFREWTQKQAKLPPDQRVDCTLAWFLHVAVDSVYRRSVVWNTSWLLHHQVEQKMKKPIWVVGCMTLESLAMHSPLCVCLEYDSLIGPDNHLLPPRMVQQLKTKVGASLQDAKTITSVVYLALPEFACDVGQCDTIQVPQEDELEKQTNLADKFSLFRHMFSKHPTLAELCREDWKRVPSPVSGKVWKIESEKSFQDVKAAHEDALSRQCARSGCPKTQLPGDPNPFQKCAGCRIRRFCSRDCQVADWPSHKVHCARLDKIRSAAKQQVSPS